jgi:hypothetical protein
MAKQLKGGKMNHEVMKKKLDTYRKSNGQFKKVSSELLVEFLRIWEGHTGPPNELAKKLGMRSKQMGFLVREARKIATSTESVDPAFHALQIQVAEEDIRGLNGIEVTWGQGKVIRFPTVDLLMDFLKRAS